MKEMRETESTFAVCLRNLDYEASLELHKLYRVLIDAEAKKVGFVRIIDESGDDYLYPETYFATIELPEAVREALIHAA